MIKKIYWENLCREFAILVTSSCLKIYKSPVTSSLNLAVQGTRAQTPGTLAIVSRPKSCSDLLL